ncbi:MULTISPECIES: DUF3576 domain-containing protein [Kordiimonas]|jgi:hypothetical protein|uniref:DUF3576 domain-containing protein n=1 Tax=Kordiimonas lacus TaxID=637679 RepID=A0A1G6THX9_9PROT|nr:MULTISPECIES: DUF3576 domain-containing protein [Kordiimonas]SDD28680.1 protein of unknown function [Kordiimonas lacus]
MQNFARTMMVLTVSLSLGACSMFGGGDKGEDTGPRTTAIGVNGYLWQAALDTLSFMPFDQVEPSGGVITTHWHSTADAPDERVKLTVRFMSQQLRSDGVKVFVVRQERKDGTWLTVPVQASTALQLEEAILERARQMRVAAAN